MDPIEEFINSLKSVDGVGSNMGSKDEELVNMLLVSWFRMFVPNTQVTQERARFTTQVFREIRRTTVHEEWLPYIMAMLDWFQTSAVDKRSSLLAIFLFGVCWHELSSGDSAP